MPKQHSHHESSGHHSSVDLPKLPEHSGTHEENEKNKSRNKHIGHVVKNLGVGYLVAENLISAHNNYEHYKTKVHPHVMNGLRKTHEFSKKAYHATRGFVKSKFAKTAAKTITKL